MSHDHHGWPDTHCTGKYPYTLLGCALGHHYKAVQWFSLVCSVPAEVSPEVVEVAGRGAEEEEGSTGVPVSGSPGLRRRWSGGASTVKAVAGRAPVRGRSRL
jgi:hypothetical protein